MRMKNFFSTAYNMNNNKIGKEVIRRVEELHLILVDQSGSRKGRRSVLTELNKILVTDISRQTRLPITIKFNDAQACYDRIILSVASLEIDGVSRAIALGNCVTRNI